ncbi:MAG: hypothetical protein JRN15_15850, partial [Nitrososphaerota archaeon]|nr:hypothetical protein [Nitrososphaerota archaeon]
GSEVSEDPGDGASLLRVPDGLDRLEVVTMTDGDDPRECHTHYVVRMLEMNLPVPLAKPRRERGARSAPTYYQRRKSGQTTARPECGDPAVCGPMERPRYRLSPGVRGVPARTRWRSCPLPSLYSVIAIANASD